MGRQNASLDNILPGIPEHSDITCLDVIYYDAKARKRFIPSWDNRPRKNAMFIIYKDGNSHKHVSVIPEPEMDIYFIKPEYRTGFRTIREYFEMDKCYTRRCVPDDILKVIREEIERSDDDISQAFLGIHNSINQAIKMGGDKEYLKLMYSGRKNLLKWPFTLMSDVRIDAYYRTMLTLRYNQMWNHTVDKCFLDIESDVYGMTTTETDNNLDPTNACTLIFKFDPHGSRKDMKPQVYTFLLRNYERYPQQEKFEKNLDKFIAECHKKFDIQQVIQSGEAKDMDCTADYHIVMYDNEGEMLAKIFETINTIKPDTCEVWNIAYDIPKMYNRMILNGVDPVRAMCDPGWDDRYLFVDLDIDRRPLDYAERKTSIRMASTTLYIDQMQTYAGIRKGRKAFGSAALDNISNIELGMGKLKFPPGVNVTNAALKDYWTFVLYNIRDVWCQYLIDEVTADTMAVIYNMNQTGCELKSLFKQVTYQRQIYNYQRMKRGFVSGNNPNVDYLHGESEELLEYRRDLEEASKRRRMLDGEDVDWDDGEEDDKTSENDSDNPDDEVDEEKDLVAHQITADIPDLYTDSVERRISLQGGLVGDPDNNIANGTELIKGVHSKHVFDDVLDMDYSSEYPWAKFTRSLSKSTQIGRLIIPEKISDKQNVLPLGMQKRYADMKYYTPGGEFVSDYLSGDVLQFGNVWFGLPDVSEMQEKLMGQTKDQKEEEGEQKHE